MRALAARQQELDRFIAIVARWNRQQRRSELAGHRREDKSACLAYVRERGANDGAFTDDALGSDV
jgi:hypothetical protein